MWFPKRMQHRDRHARKAGRGPRPGLALAESLERRDCPATVGISGPASIAEGDTGTYANAAYSVVLSEPLTTTATIAYTVVGGSAALGMDYSAPAGVAGRLTFAPGETTKSVAVRVLGDTLREASETFSVRLSSPVGCTIGTASVTTTIVDNDSYTLSIEAPATTVTEGSPATITLKLSARATRTEVVAISTSDGTAKAGSDYAALSGRTVTFLPGQDTKVVSVPTYSDIVAEGAEYFTFTARPYDARFPQAKVNVFVTDAGTPGPPPAVVTVAPAVATATEAGPTAGTLRFTRVGSTTAALAVNYAVSGTATPATDYAALMGVATIAAGDTFVDVPVAPVDDSLEELPETVTVTLQAGTGYLLGAATAASVTIISDDTPALVTVEAVTDKSYEGSTSGVLRFTRTGSTTAALAVNYAVSGTATAGTDYTALPSVSFPAGVASVDVLVTALADGATELAETVTLTLQPGLGYRISTATVATVTIIDVDRPRPRPGFQIDFLGLEGMSTNIRTMFSQAAGKWSYYLEDVPDFNDASGRVVDDFELIVEFRTGPRSILDPLYIPWQQEGFGGAEFTHVRSGIQGLPYRGRIEITTNALNPNFFKPGNATYDKFLVYKTTELIGRALGFDINLMVSRGLVSVRTFIGIGTVTVVDRTTTAASKWRFGDYKIPDVPLDQTNLSIARWTSDFGRFGGLKNFGFDVFVTGWQNQKNVDGSYVPKISNITLGLFADLGYVIKRYN